jgi:hypothetical protein
MKLGWGVIHEPESFWVVVLRGKYVRTYDLVPSIKARSQDSPLWKVKSLA